MGGGAEDEGEHRGARAQEAPQARIRATPTALARSEPARSGSPAHWTSHASRARGSPRLYDHRAHAHRVRDGRGRGEEQRPPERERREGGRRLGRPEHRSCQGERAGGRRERREPARVGGPVPERERGRRRDEAGPEQRPRGTAAEHLRHDAAPPNQDGAGGHEPAEEELGRGALEQGAVGHEPDARRREEPLARSRRQIEMAIGIEDARPSRVVPHFLTGERLRPVRGRRSRPSGGR